LEGLPWVRYPVSKTGGPSEALGVRLPLLPLLEAWPSGKGSALLARRAPCVPQVRVLLPPYVRSGAVDLVRRATVTREEQVRSLPPELARPRGRTGDDAGLSIRKLRVRAPPGVLRLAVGELATPPVSGTGDRRFEPCRPDLRARWRRGLSREPHELETRVRIPPALCRRTSPPAAAQLSAAF
jgi:hypothetical protein